MFKRKMAAISAAATLLVGFTGYGLAQAAIPDSQTSEFTACVANFTRTVKIIDKEAGETCGYGYTEKTFNQTGPQGAPGAQGPAGPQGPQGPQGEPGSDATLPLVYYRNNSPSVTVPAGQTVRVDALCNENDRALGGGGLTASYTSDVQLVVSSPTENFSGWMAIYRNNSAASIQAFAMATCLDTNEPTVYFGVDGE